MKKIFIGLFTLLALIITTQTATQPAGSVCSAPSVSFSNDGFGFTVDGPCALSHYTPSYCDNSVGAKVEDEALEAQDQDSNEDDFSTILIKEIKSISWKAGGYEGVISRDCDTPPEEVPGCTDPTAYNYDQSATEDDDSCVYDQCLNIDGLQTSVSDDDYQENGNCYPKTPVCTDELANNDVSLTGGTYSDPDECEYDEHPYCDEGQTVMVPDNQTPPNGATPGSCDPTDLCSNLDGNQETIPDGYEGLENGTCRLKPTPTPTPEPTPTPTPGLGKQSKTAITDPVCVGQNFDAIMELFLDGNPVKDVQVKFIYNGEAKYAKTNADGKASVAFGFIEGQDVVKFEPEDGYPTQLQTILKSASCKTPEVLGATTGKVLGATTLAKTGVAEDALINLAGLMGAGMTVSGLSLYVKKRK